MACGPCKDDMRFRRTARDLRDYRTLVTFQSPGNLEGDVVTESDWNSEFSAYVAMKARGSKEVDFANRVDPQVDVIAWAAYSATIWGCKSSWRLTLNDPVHGQRTFELAGPPINVEERSREIEFRLVETSNR